jgi:hypothetical protein
MDVILKLSRFAKIGNLHVYYASVLPQQGLFQPIYTVLHVEDYVRSVV